ncbi:MAG: hypothetical protein IKH38_04810 [Clostridia bacterium]|nr:hypothetical protein [Clostridia bacterium]
MKKLIAVLMSLCLILTAAAAFAEDVEPSVVNWSDYEATAAEIDGQFATVSDIGLKMFIPAEFKDTELSDEALEGGTFMVLKSEKEERALVNAQHLAIDISSFKAGLESQGATVYETVLNGLHCYQFNVGAEGVITSCFAFGTDQGSVVLFGFTLTNEEPYSSLFKVMAASIQPAE